MESKKERFKRLAAARTNAILHRIKVLSNCANPQLYEYEEQDIDKIFSEIEKNVREAKSRFHFSKPKKRQFKL